jgi:anaerobic ribonucleoside-triphosphate reductase activating protein
MLRILDITAPDINNGNGVRVTLWVAGCKHHCKGCHNQWTWDFEQGKYFDKDIFDKLNNWLSRDYIEGLTISGGDPLCQDNSGLIELKSLIYWFRSKFPNKNIWMYTGYVYDDLVKMTDVDAPLRKEIAESVDVLVDGPFIEEQKNFDCPFRGSSNQRILHFNRNK